MEAIQARIRPTVLSVGEAPGRSCATKDGLPVVARSSSQCFSPVASRTAYTSAWKAGPAGDSAMKASVQSTVESSGPRPRASAAMKPGSFSAAIPNAREFMPSRAQKKRYCPPKPGIHRVGRRGIWARMDPRIGRVSGAGNGFRYGLSCATQRCRRQGATVPVWSGGNFSERPARRSRNGANCPTRPLFRSADRQAPVSAIARDGQRSAPPARRPAVVGRHLCGISARRSSRESTESHESAPGSRAPFPSQRLTYPRTEMPPLHCFPRTDKLLLDPGHALGEIGLAPASSAKTAARKRNAPKKAHIAMKLGVRDPAVPAPARPAG